MEPESISHFVQRGFPSFCVDVLTVHDTYKQDILAHLECMFYDGLDSAIEEAYECDTELGEGRSILIDAAQYASCINGLAALIENAPDGADPLGILLTRSNEIEELQRLDHSKTLADYYMYASLALECVIEEVNWIKEERESKKGMGLAS